MPFTDWRLWCCCHPALRTPKTPTNVRNQPLSDVEDGDDLKVASLQRPAPREQHTSPPPINPESATREEFAAHLRQQGYDALARFAEPHPEVDMSPPPAARLPPAGHGGGNCHVAPTPDALIGPRSAPLTPASANVEVNPAELPAITSSRPPSGFGDGLRDNDSTAASASTPVRRLRRDPSPKSSKTSSAGTTIPSHVDEADEENMRRAAVHNAHQRRREEKAAAKREMNGQQSREYRAERESGD